MEVRSNARLIKWIDAMRLPKLEWTDIVNPRLEEAERLRLDRNRVAAALDHLRQALGDNLEEYPDLMLRNLFNLAPWTFVWLEHLSERLVALSKAVGFASLRSRMSDPTKFLEAYSVFHIAERMQSVGFSVAFDVPVNVAGRRKTPDLHIEGNGPANDFYIEVSVLHLSSRQTADGAVMNAIVRRLMHTPNVVFAGRLLNDIAKDAVSGMLGRVSWSLLEVARHQVFQEIMLPEGLELIVAPSTDSARVAVWAADRGLKVGAFAGSPSPVDLKRRLELKMADEAAQLPMDRGNMLAIEAEEILFMVARPFDLIPLFTGMLAGHPHVTAMTIFGETLKHLDASVTEEHGAQYATGHRMGVGQAFLTVANPTARLPMTENLRCRVWQAMAM